MAAIEPASLITAVSDAISKLFGRPALALLLMSLVFFLLPAPWLAAIGIDQFKSGWRAAAGVALVAGAVMCFVSAVPYLFAPLKAAGSWVASQRRYQSVPLGSRILLALHVGAGEDHIISDARSEDFQALLDHNFIYQITNKKGVISAEIGPYGRSFIQQHRKKLRDEMKSNQSECKRLFDATEKAREQFFSRF